jgi:hypothetical protein
VFARRFPPAPPHEAAHESQVHHWRDAGLLVREAVCAIRGHDYFQHAEGAHMFLRCAECGHETHGWYIDLHE